MRYLHTMVRVQDVDASMHFYCDLLGMVQTRRMDSEKGRFSLIFLAADADETASAESKSPLLELTYNWPTEGETAEQYDGGRNFGHLAYKVDDIYATCQKLQDAGVTILRPPRDGYMAFVRSPDGISLELLQEGDAKEPVEPWASMENTGNW